MTKLSYHWNAADGAHDVNFVRVPGTAGEPYPFGTVSHGRSVEVRPFYVATVPVTQSLWEHVMDSNPAVRPDPCSPVENVSWEGINRPGGFLDRINSSEIISALRGTDDTLKLRLPSETEWEYAARGGPHWTDGFVFSGSNDPDAVAWYGPRWSTTRRLGMRILGRRLGWRLLGRRRFARPTRTHPVATKAPNQLGIYDMCGNVWEWCQDVCVDEIDAVPADGTPYLGPASERRLRGGCHHNWDIHCTVSFRYGISPDAHDGCIGFRLVLAPH